MGSRCRKGSKKIELISVAHSARRSVLLNRFGDRAPGVPPNNTKILGRCLVLRLPPPLVVLVIGQLFGLNPLAVLTSITGVLRLVPVREYVVFADEIIL